MQCKFCDTKMLEVTRIQSLVTHFKYTLFECTDCSSRFFDHNEHNVSLSKLYEDLAQNRAQFPVDFLEKPYWKNQKNIVTKLLGKPPESVLDVGSRTGDFLMHFNRSTNKEGVELSPFYCSISRERGIKTHQDFLENVQFENTFDIVSSYAIMEHLVDPINFLQKLNTLVKPGGVLVIMIPSHQTLKAKFLSKKWHMNSPPEHLNFYSRKFLDSFLSDHAFSLKKRYYSVGGMFKPFHNTKILKPLHSKIPFLLDSIPFIKRIPIYDHMFSYYKKDF